MFSKNKLKKQIIIIIFQTSKKSTSQQVQKKIQLYVGVVMLLCTFMLLCTLTEVMQNHSNNISILILKKSSSEYRFCFDGRELNEVTKHNIYLLSRLAIT